MIYCLFLVLVITVYYEVTYMLYFCKLIRPLFSSRAVMLLLSLPTFFYFIFNALKNVWIFTKFTPFIKSVSALSTLLLTISVITVRPLKNDQSGFYYLYPALSTSS
jgi:hypothetical protein